MPGWSSAGRKDEEARTKRKGSSCSSCEAMIDAKKRGTERSLRPSQKRYLSCSDVTEQEEELLTSEESRARGRRVKLTSHPILPSRAELNASSPQATLRRE